MRIVVLGPRGQFATVIIILNILKPEECFMKIYQYFPNEKIESSGFRTGEKRINNKERYGMERRKIKEKQSPTGDSGGSFFRCSFSM